MKYKIYSGAGNDFVMINNWSNIVPPDKQKEFTIKACNDNFKDIDGVIFLDKPVNGGDLRMSYYNRDGSFGAMCGNGARCTAQFATDEGLLKEKSFTLEAVDKIYNADILGGNIVKISFPQVSQYTLSLNIGLSHDLSLEELHWIYVGSEHLIIYLDDIEEPEIKSLDKIKIDEWGRELRYHKDFQPKGANVNFVQVISEHELRIRTYERGVERETLACGTGIVSSAIVSALLGRVRPPVKILVQSGEWLEVDFKIVNKRVEDLSLQGSAKKIGEGEI